MMIATALRRVRATAPLLLLVGCGEPTGSAGHLSGSWVYSADAVASPGDPITCSYREIPVELVHRGDRLTGQTTGGFGECVRADGLVLPAVPLRAATINGSVNGVEVSFEVGDFLQNDGVFSAGVITGRALFRPDVEGEFALRRL